MPRPGSSTTARNLVLVACAASLSCDASPGSGGGPGAGSIDSHGVTIADQLSAVPEPAIDWQPEVYGAPRTGSAPYIDGSLADTAWERAPWTADFVDIQGGSMPAPRHRTRARMLWDDEYLFIGAEIEEPHVWSTLTERDAVIYYDNDFEVFIDPDADTHLYYELEVNAQNTVWDLMLIKPYRDGGPAVDAWDIQGLRTAVAVQGTLNEPADEDRGWSVEIAIPWDVLAEAAGRPAPPEPGDRWRVNFSRVQWRTTVEDGRYVKLTDDETGEPFDEDNWVWSPQGLIAMHYPEMWGIVEFVESETAAGAADLTPSERAMWALRHVYYRQRQHAADHGSWAPDAALLGLGSPAPGDLPWPPSIFLTPSGFEATLELGDGSIAHIAEDGRTWVSD
jgi:hypothetical protein